jgi:hypothetical protein
MQRNIKTFALNYLQDARKAISNFLAEMPNWLVYRREISRLYIL